MSKARSPRGLCSRTVGISIDVAPRWSAQMCNWLVANVARRSTHVQPWSCTRSIEEHVMHDPAVRRRVDLQTSVADAWHLVTDDAELGAWLGGTVRLPLEAGSTGTFVGADGTLRRIAVD